jgi:vitamin B12 transporter
VYLSRFGSARNTLDWTLSKALDGHNSIDAGLNFARESGYSHEFYAGGFEEDRAMPRCSCPGAATSTATPGPLRCATTTTASSAAQPRAASPGAGRRRRSGACARAWARHSAHRISTSCTTRLRDRSGVSLFAGNPLLDPERSESAEAGLDWSPSARTRVGLSLYRTRWKT